MINPFELLAKTAPKPTIGDRIVSTLVILILVSIVILATIGAYHLITGK